MLVAQALQHRHLLQDGHKVLLGKLEGELCLQVVLEQVDVLVLQVGHQLPVHQVGAVRVKDQDHLHNCGMMKT